MPDDERFTWGFVLEVLDVLERHGYRPSDDQHAGQALGLIRDVIRIYEGSQDAPRGGYVVMPSSRPPPPQPPDPFAVIVSANEVKILLAALGDAAEYKRDRVETCADCTGQSCPTCQWRLQTISAYDQLTARLLGTASASPARAGTPPGPEHASGSPAQPPQPGKEAGQ